MKNTYEINDLVHVDFNYDYLDDVDVISVHAHKEEM